MALAFPLAKELTSAISLGSIQRLIGVSLTTQSARPPGSRDQAAVACSLDLPLETMPRPELASA